MHAAMIVYVFILVGISEGCVPKGYYDKTTTTAMPGGNMNKSMVTKPQPNNGGRTRQPTEKPQTIAPKVNPLRWKPQPVPHPNPIPFIRPGHTLRPLDPYKKQKIKGAIPFIPWYWSTTTTPSPNDTNTTSETKAVFATGSSTTMPPQTLIDIRCGTQARGECPRIREDNGFPVACDWSKCHKLFFYEVSKGFCFPRAGRITQEMVWDSELCGTLCLQMHNCVGFSFMEAAQKCHLETDWCGKESLQPNPYYVSYKRLDPVGFGCVYKQCIEEVQRYSDVGFTLSECAQRCRRDAECRSFNWGPTVSGKMFSRNEKLSCHLMASEGCEVYQFNTKSLHCAKVF